MLIDLEKLVQASSINVLKDGIIELELEGKAPEVMAASGEIIFVCQFCDSVVICIGRVEKYQELEPDEELGQDLFARLHIRGRSISFTI